MTAAPKVFLAQLLCLPNLNTYENASQQSWAASQQSKNRLELGTGLVHLCCIFVTGHSRVVCPASSFLVCRHVSRSSSAAGRPGARGSPGPYRATRAVPRTTCIRRARARGPIVKGVETAQAGTRLSVSHESAAHVAVTPVLRLRAGVPVVPVPVPTTPLQLTPCLRRPASQKTSGKSG